MLKRSMIAFLLICLLIPQTGCVLSFNEPENLIAAPASNREELKERELVNSFLSHDEKIQVPHTMENAAPYFDIDIDHDGVAEKIVFWSKKNGFQAGISLLKKKDEKWSIYDKTTQSGKEISYFNMLSLDNQEKLLFLGIDVGPYKTLHIYRLTDSGFLVKDQLNYSQLELVDIKNSGHYSLIAALNGTSENLTCDVSMYELDTAGSNSLKRTYYQTFRGFCQEMKFGQVAQGKQGLYLAMGNDSDYVDVSLLFYTGRSFYEQLHQSTSYSMSFLDSAMGIIKDIDGDGILEILDTKAPTDASKRSPRDFLQIWKRGDGNTNFQITYATIDNRSDGYKLDIPVEWLSSLNYQYYITAGENQLRIYDGSSGLSDAKPVFTIFTQERNEEAPDYGQLLGKSESKHKNFYVRFYNRTFHGKNILFEDVQKGFAVKGGA